MYRGGDSFLIHCEYQVMLPDIMPAHFQSTYTPIAAAGTQLQIKHMARLLATQLVTGGLGKGDQQQQQQKKQVSYRFFIHHMSWHDIQSSLQSRGGQTLIPVSCMENPYLLYWAAFDEIQNLLKIDGYFHAEVKYIQLLFDTQRK